MLPTFLGLGAPKAATTWLFRCLQAHPEVFVTDVKETEYFSWRHTMVGLDDYKAHFEDAGEARAVGEISTSYLFWGNGTAARAARVVPDARLFVSLRNPMDQVYSHYWHLRRQNFHQNERPRPESFEKALDMYPDKLLRPAQYAEHLERWQEQFSAGQLRLFFYDDIQERPGQVVRNLYAFLDVDPSFRPDLLTQDRSVRRGTSPKSTIYERLYTGLYDALTRYAYDPLRSVLGSRRANQLKNNLGVRAWLESLFRDEGYPDMDPDTRERLRDHFADDIDRLEQMTGRDLSHWT